VGGTLDPVSFGAFASCPTTTPLTPTTWTFKVQTADTWAQTSLGVWKVGIDTDGNVNDNCSGDEYQAVVQQSKTSPGMFTAQVGGVNSSCAPSGPQQTPAVTIGTNSVALTFPLSAIGNNNALIWNGILQSRTEQLNQMCTSPCGDVVPSTTSTDSSLIQGAVADSLPGRTPTSCTTNPSSTEVATTSNSSRAATDLLNAGGFTDVRDFGEGIVSFTGNAATAQGVLALDGITAQIAPGQAYQPLATVTSPNDYNSTTEWNLGVIGAPGPSGAWSITNGSGVVVADVDTGVDYTQPDFRSVAPAPPSSNLLNGFDESTGLAMGPAAAEAGNTDTGQPGNDNGHGTAVAGMIAAFTNNHLGLASLGFNTRVLPVKVNFGDAAVGAEIDAGIRWAADASQQHPLVNVINLSLGGSCPDSNLLSAIQFAQSQGILVVTAAGNGALNSQLDPTGANDAPIYPAAYSTKAPPATPGAAAVIAVSATGRDGLRAAYSNTGPYVSMVAPGGSNDGNAADDLPVLATRDTCLAAPCFATAHGTSLAAAEVSAAAALIWSVSPKCTGAATPPSCLTASQVSELLKSTVTDQGVSGTDLEYGTGMENAGVALADTPPTTAGYGMFESVSPTRILDTRIPCSTCPPAPLKQGETRALQVAPAVPLNGSPNNPVVPANGVSAVVLNVTVTGASGASFLAVWPAGQPQPNASNINFTAGETLPNLVTVKVGSGGQVDIFNAAGSVNVIVDVAGYYLDGTVAPPVGSPPPSSFVPLSPVRLLDTRQTRRPVVQGIPQTLAVTSSGGLVPNSATGVVVNVTVTAPTTTGFLTVYPAGSSVPNASNLNFTRGETIPNLVSVQLGAIGGGPTEGINLFTPVGSVHVIVDLEGYFAPGNASGSGSRFFPTVAHRILDTRSNIGGFSAPITGGTPIPVAVTGQGGVLDGATAVIMNTTVTAPTASGFLTVFPGNLSSPPNISNLNFTAGETIANLVSVQIGLGQDKFFNAAGSAHAIADVVGWYGPPGT
jgi:subtilisin family serine protease